jgi:nucleotide-binding universal stress UspA family protein
MTVSSEQASVSVTEGTSEKFMHRAASPTLLCYDGSSSSKRAIAVAGNVLALDHVVILHSWERPIEALADSYSEPGRGGSHSLEELEALEATRATAIADEGVQLALSVGLNATMAVQRADGDEWHVILEVADRIDAGLIVLGTRGATALDADLLGTSVSSDVLHHSLRPVLVVPELPEAARHS